MPFPANYGGAIDVYARIVALHKIGQKIWLHCFYTERKPARELENLCEKVFYYPRKTGIFSLPIFTPYMAYSRRNADLITLLNQDTAPILFEGLHTCYILPFLTNKKDRKIAIRMHNVEWEYYALLAKAETHFWQKIYFKWEAFLLKKFEKRIDLVDTIYTISPNDTFYFAKKHKQVAYLPAAHLFGNVEIMEGKGAFCLYHGNLSVAENHQAALFLVEKVYPLIHIPLYIAGANPRKELFEKISQYPHIQLIENPNEAEMARLIREAHLHILPTFQATGIKLKLLNALYKGRFVIASPEMVANTGVENLCIVCGNVDKFQAEIKRVFELLFSVQEIAHRKEILNELFSIEKQAEIVLANL